MKLATTETTFTDEFVTLHGIKSRYKVGKYRARQIAGEVGYIKAAGRILVRHSDLEAWEAERLIQNAPRSTISAPVGETHAGVWRRVKAPGDLADDWWNE